MLRITRRFSAQAAIVCLHGKLLGPWLAEVNDTVARLPSDILVQVDLQDLGFADPDGIKLLVELRRRGIELVNIPLLIAALLERQQPTQ